MGKTIVRFATLGLLLGAWCASAGENWLIVAHRGASDLAPENTLAAFKLAWELGAEVIEADMMLMDATVLDSPIMYPTDVRLLYKALGKMAILATESHMEPWWDTAHLKTRWRAYNLDRHNRLAYLSEFSMLFQPALAGLEERLDQLEAPLDDRKKSARKARWRRLVEVLQLLGEQTEQK